MAQELNPADFEVINQQPVAPSAPVQQPSAVGTSAPPSPKQPELNPNDFEELPSIANGFTAETAINSSPLDIIERAKLSLGNKAGNIAFLKNRFEKVQPLKDGTLSVFKDGSWYKVDPNFGESKDPWEFAKDAADMIGGALPIAGATAGGALGAGVGSVPLAGGGAGLGEGIRTSLGRIVGTYEATPEEQLKDIGWEAVMGLAGEALVLGAKPTIQALKNTMKKAGSGLTNYGKELMSSVLERTTGEPRWAMRRAFDNPEAVLSKTDELIKSLGPNRSPLDAKDIAKSKQIGIFKSLASDGDQQLKSQYRRDLGNLVATTPDDFSANISSIISDVQQGLVDQGYGKIIRNGKVTKFAPYTEEELALKFGTEATSLPKILGENTVNSIKELGNILNKYQRLGEVNGKQGAVALAELRKALTNSLDSVFTSDMPAEGKRVAAQIKEQTFQKIGEQFAKHGNGENFIKMNENYAKYKDSVDLFKKAVESDNPNAVDTAIQQLVSKAGSFRSLKDEALHMSQLLGPDGAKRLQSLTDWEAAKSFVDYVPKNTGGGDSLILKGIGMATQSGNPRAVKKVIQGADKLIPYANKSLDFIKGLDAATRQKVLGDDNALRLLFQLPVQLQGQEDSLTQSILQSSGVSSSNSSPMTLPNGGQSNGQQQ